MGSINHTMGELKKNYRIEKAKLEGKAMSQAVRIRPLAEVRELSKDTTVMPPGPARPTDARVRMPDGTPMVYWTDGSLRHLTGYKPGKAARKAQRRSRQR